MKWWKWLMASVHDLEAMGFSSKERIQHCGHTHAMTPRWARTVGLWGGVATAKQIMQAAGVSRTAYENFKHRHQLQTCGRKQPSLQHDVSLVAYVAVRNLLVGETSPGEAAHAAAKAWRRDPKLNPGMLPVELLLRWADMSIVLEIEGLTDIKFNSLSDAAAEVVYARHTQLSFVPDEAFDIMG